MTKKEHRQAVFNKFGGRCAYCGCQLDAKFHVDDVLPCVRTWKYKRDENGNLIPIPGKFSEYEKVHYMEHPERLDIDNQVPACASCNINKHSYGLEEFRRLITGFMKHLNEVNTQYKIAKRYGLVKETDVPVKFYFETL